MSAGQSKIDFLSNNKADAGVETMRNWIRGMQDAIEKQYVFSLYGCLLPVDF